MGRMLPLEAFGEKPKQEEVVEAPPIPAEETELWRMGHETGFAAGRHEGYAEGAAAAGAEHKAVLAVAGAAIEQATTARDQFQHERAIAMAETVRAALAAVLPEAMRRGLLDEAAAVLNDWLGRASDLKGVLHVAPDIRAQAKDAFQDHPRLADLTLEADERLDRFAMRFEWRDGLGEIDLEAAKAAVLAALDQSLADARAPMSSAQMAAAQT